jgi:hypothetical protein
VRMDGNEMGVYVAVARRGRIISQCLICQWIS